VLAILLQSSKATESPGQQSSAQEYDIPLVLTRWDTHTDPNSQRLEPSRKREDLVKDIEPENFQVQVGGLATVVHGKPRRDRPASADSEERIFDALLAAANRFDPPQFGDMVILVGRVVDSSSKTTLAELINLFLKNRLRFIGLSVSLAPGISNAFDPKPLPQGNFLPQLASLCGATGYFIWTSDGYSSVGLRVLVRVYRRTLPAYDFDASTAGSCRARHHATAGFQEKEDRGCHISLPSILLTVQKLG
jgi:hypothetical protein